LIANNRKTAIYIRKKYIFTNQFIIKQRSSILQFYNYWYNN